MLILSIEQSTDVCSVALSRDCETIAERKWEENRLRNQYIFSVLPELLDKASVSMSDIDIFATGLGPGSFSGLRCAIAALQGIAMPEKKHLFGITSAETLAWQTMKETGRDSVIVLGDARRSFIWHAAYDRGHDMPIKRGQVSLVPVDQLSSVLSTCKTAVTSDWDRIGATLKQSTPSDVVIIDGRRTPSASTTGELACTKINRNLPSEPLLPIYLHPPVSARPAKPEPSEPANKYLH